MKKLTFLSLIVLFFSTISIGGEMGLLTIDETLNLTFRRSIHGTNNPDVARANPAARGALYQLLGDRSKTTQWSAAVSLFGFIGEKEDVPKIEAWLKSRKGNLDANEGGAVMVAFGTLGNMALRGVEGAEGALVSMASPSYWKDVDCTIVDAGTPKGPSMAFYLASASLRGLAYTSYADLDKLSDKLLSLTENVPDRNQVNVHVAAAKQIREYWGTPARRKELLDAFKSRPAAGTQPTPDATSDPISTKPVVAKGSCCGDDKRGPSPMKVVKLMSVDATTVDLFSEANKAFEHLEASLLAGKSGEVLESVLDDGEPVDRIRLNKLKEVYEKAFPIQSQAIKAVIDGKCKPIKIHIIQTSNTSIDRLDGDGKFSVAEINNDAIITYELEGSEAIGKRLFAGNKFDNKTVGENGEMIVYMRKINNKWYWNPFTW